MTTLTLNQFGSLSSAIFRQAPRKSFAARLAALQAKQEQHRTSLVEAVSIAGYSVAASLPVLSLAWMFIAV